jgi:hypothetical protein
LAVEFPADAASWPVADEVMVGPGLLVAPVQTMGASSRGVYLPPGTWFPWSGGSAIAGGQTITAQAPLAEIPVYALAGTLVPTYPDGVQTLVREPSNAAGASRVGDDRIVYAFAGGGGTTFTESPEAGGLTYTMQPTSSSASSPEWNGVPLPVCDAALDAPCAQLTQGIVTARVVGSGTLVTSGTTLTASGGAKARSITWIVRLR